MLKNVREAGGAFVIIDVKELSGLHGKFAYLQVTDLIFGLKIYREKLLYQRGTCNLTKAFHSLVCHIT